jgi:hypothetical protein
VSTLARELTRTCVSELPPLASTESPSASLIKLLATERLACRSSELSSLERRLAGGLPLRLTDVDAPSRRIECRSRDVYVKPSRPCAAGELGVDADGKLAPSTAAVLAFEFECSRGVIGEWSPAVVSRAPPPPPPPPPLSESGVSGVPIIGCLLDEEKVDGEAMFSRC